MTENQYKIGAILSYVSLGLKNIISILYTPLLLRMLGQSEYGLYNLSNSVVGYLGILDMGFGSAVIRYISKYRSEENKEGEYNLIGMFIILYSIIAMLVIVGGTGLVSSIDNLFSRTLNQIELEQMKYLMILMIFNLTVTLPFSIFSAIISAYERFIFPKILDIFRTILNPMIMIPLLFLGYKSVAITVASTIINIICIIVNVYYCFVILKIKIRFNKMNFLILKEVSGYSFFIFINIIVDKIYWSTDQFVLGSIVGASAVAVYSVGSNLNTYYMSFSGVLSSMFLPKITRMISKGVEVKELSNLFIKIGRIQYIIMSLICSGFILLGKEFIGIWAGEGYQEAYYITLVVMIPLTIPLIQNVGLEIMRAMNIHKFRSKITLIIAALNLIASIPLAKIYGGIGAAIATSGALIIGNIVIMNIYYYKKVKIDINKFWKEIIKMSIPVIISVVIGILIFRVVRVNGILGFGIKGSIFVVIYSVLMWKLGMNNYEKELLCKPIDKIYRKLRGL